MEILANDALKRFLEENAGWALVDVAISREWQFPDFVKAMGFVNRVAEMAEAAGHHPDIDIRYNRVRLTLVTHDAGGITAKDADFARSLGV